MKRLERGPWPRTVVPPRRQIETEELRTLLLRIDYWKCGHRNVTDLVRKDTDSSQK